MSNLIKIGPGEEFLNLDLRNLGGKAKEQALAAAQGFPVPEGLVLTTDYCPSQDWLAEKASLKSSAQRVVEVRHFLRGRGVDLPKELNTLKANRFAVRSSATSEDLETASFAGSFTTRLNVHRKGLYRAIFDVWNSTYSDRVRQYLADRGMMENWKALKMAVLIQPMIDPLFSGVGLSHPLGQPESPFLEIGIVRGIGEPLVSGEVEPQTFQLERGSWVVMKHNSKDSFLVYEFASRIGGTLERLELLRGTPQDIEFAVSRDFRFILLQNRPIVSAMKG